MLSADFLKKVARDLERERPKGDPGRPYDRFVPVEGKSWTMSRPQQECEEPSGSPVASNMINVVGAVGDMARLNDKIDADVRTPAGRLRNSDPTRAATIVLVAMAEPIYDAWRTCRDRMEYTFRPRL